MYNTDLVKVYDLKNGTIEIETPYNEAFKDELKVLVPSATWQAPYWVIKSSGKEQAQQLLAKYYPPESELPNPLAQFSPEELLAELKVRGVK